MTRFPSSYLEQYLEPYRDLIVRDDVIELAINPDGHVWIERQGAHAMERIDRTVEAAAAANLAATMVGDAQARVSQKSPLVTGKIDYLGRPLRIQVVVPPAVEPAMPPETKILSVTRPTTEDEKPCSPS